MAEYRYFKAYKPYKVLCQFSDPGSGKTTLGDVFDLPKDVYPLGRLDEDSEGMLLLSNDPSMNARMLGKNTEKEYLVQVEGEISEEAMAQLREGIEIRVRKKNYTTLPCKAERIPEPELPERIPPIRYRKNIPETWISLTIREGKNRQVRKMTAATGFPTLRLVRYRVGSHTIRGMQPGEIKETEKF